MTDAETQVAAALEKLSHTYAVDEARTLPTERLFGFWISRVYGELGYANKRPPVDVREAAERAVLDLIPALPRPVARK